MAIVNFSVPDEIKRAFEREFRRENKSAVVARLMLQAVEERERRRRRSAAIEAILELRRTQRPVSTRRAAAARRKARP